MKKRHAQLCILALLMGGMSFTACKGKSDKNADTTVTTDTTVKTTVTAPPPVIATADALKAGVTDALKDYPSVKGEVSDSVIVLTGDIKRADWQKLMPTLNSLHPKRVNSTNLTIK